MSEVRMLPLHRLRMAALRDEAGIFDIGDLTRRHFERIYPDAMHRALAIQARP